MVFLFTGSLYDKSDSRNCPSSTSCTTNINIFWACVLFCFSVFDCSFCRCLSHNSSLYLTFSVYYATLEVSEEKLVLIVVLFYSILVVVPLIASYCMHIYNCTQYVTHSLYVASHMYVLVM